MKFSKTHLIVSSFLTISNTLSCASDPLENDPQFMQKLTTSSQAQEDVDLCQKRLDTWINNLQYPEFLNRCLTRDSLSRVPPFDRENVLENVIYLADQYPHHLPIFSNFPELIEITHLIPRDNRRETLNCVSDLFFYESKALGITKLINFLRSTTITKRVEVLSRIKLLRRYGIKDDVSALKTIVNNNSLSITDIEDATYLATPLLKMIKEGDAVDGHLSPYYIVPGIRFAFHKVELIRIIAELFPEDRLPILNLLMSGVEIYKEIERAPNVTEILDIKKPLVEICHKIGITPGVIQILSLIPHTQREACVYDISNILIPVIIKNVPLPAMGVRFYTTPLLHTIRLLGVLHEDFRYSMFHNIVTTMESDPETFQESVSPYSDFAPQTLNQYFLENDLKEKLFHYWSETLYQCPDKAKVKKIANFITEYYQNLGLFYISPLVQLAIRTGILLDTSDDPQSPYRFFETIKQKRAEAIDLTLIKPPVEIIDGVSFQFNPQFFKDTLPQFVLIFSQLPKHSKNFLAEKIKQLDQLQQQDCTFNTVVESMTEEQNYHELKKGALGDNLLENYLKISGAADEKIPSLVAARFVASVAYLESLSDQREEGTLLSPQQEAFLKMLVSIRGCPFGKDEGANAYYLNVLPPEFRLVPLTQEEKEDTVYQKSKAQVVSHLTTEIEKMFSGQNLFAKFLAGLKANEEIEQAAHTATYLKNIIGDMVLGIKEPRFDSHTQLLPKDLVDKSKLEMLQAFYKYFPASKFVYKISEEYKLEDLDTIDQLELMGILKILPFEWQ